MKKFPVLFISVVVLLSIAEVARADIAAPCPVTGGVCYCGGQAPSGGETGNAPLSILPSGIGAITFLADITHAQEVLPDGTIGTPNRGMSGSATLVLNATQTALSYSITLFGVDFNGLQTPGDPTDNMTAAHIHASPTSFPGVNAGVVFGFLNPNSDINPPNLVITPFTTGVGGTITGVWDLPEGNAGQTLATQLPNLLAGTGYVNIHTQLFPGGEIRGQIIPQGVGVPEPSSWALAFLGAAGLAGVWLKRRWQK